METIYLSPEHIGSCRYLFHEIPGMKYSRCSFSTMVKQANDGLLQAYDGKMLVNDGEMLVNDGEMLVNDGEMII